ncbi:MAG: alpha-L-rhamnosidase N-terminal domain-containing protein [Deinococcales bacterium]
MSKIRVASLRLEHLPQDSESLKVIGISQPRLSWQIESSINNWQQSAYEILCTDENGQTSTGRIASEQSVLVAWPFKPLVSRAKRSLKVRVWGTKESASAWSEALEVEAGLLQSDDWQARFISPDWQEDTSKPTPAPYFRSEFKLEKAITSAKLYLTALGIYQAELNGQAVGDQVFAPGWTVYHDRLRYQTFEVRHLLQEGSNAIGVMVGEGWYRGRLGFGGGRRNIYGHSAGLLAQLEIFYQDGSSTLITSNDTWRAATGPILMSSIYDGENYDARLEHQGWSETGFDDSGWSKVRVLEQDLSILEAPLGHGG